MRNTRILSMLLALIMVLGMLPVSAFATDSDLSSVPTAATAASETEAGESDGTVTGWQSFGGNNSLEYSDGAMHIHSKTTPGTVIFADRTFENYEMELQMQLHNGSWFGAMYRAIEDHKGLFMVSPGANGTHRLAHHITSDGWVEADTTQSQGKFSVYSNGQVMKLKIRVENNKISVWSQMESDADYVAEFTNFAIPAALQGPGFVGIGMYTSDVTVYSATIKDLDSDYTYQSDFEALSPEPATQGEWKLTRGNAVISKTDGVYTFAAESFPSIYMYSGAKMQNYVMEAEYSLAAGYGAVVLRANGTYHLMHRFGVGSTYAYRGLIGYDSAGSAGTWTAEANRVASREGYTAYSAGDRVRVKYTVQNNLLTVQSMIVGKDTQWFTEIENYDMAAYDGGKLSNSGEIGLLAREGAQMGIYDFTVTDTDTGNVLKLLDMEGSWTMAKGEGTVTEENNVLTITPSSRPDVYLYGGAPWKNYTMEAELSIDKYYAGIALRTNGDYTVMHRIGAGSTYGYRGLIGYDASTNGWTADANRVAAATGYSNYAYGNRIKVRYTVQNDLLTVQSKLVGTDTQWFTEIENYDLKNYDGGLLGSAGEIGFIARDGSNLSIYGLSVKDNDTGYIYNMFDQEGAWTATRGTVNITEENDHLKMTTGNSPAVYLYSGANWENYVMETEFSVSGNYGGIALRTNGTYSVLHRFGEGDYSYRGLIGYTSDTNKWTAAADRVPAQAGYTAYAYGDRVKVRYTVNDNLLTIQSMIVGKDTDWFTELENYDLTTYDGGKLGVSGEGEVGFIFRQGCNMLVYEFSITDTVTGQTYDLIAPEDETADTPNPTPITNGVVFDGNHVIDTSGPITKTPDTIEVWFKTSDAQEQTLISNFWADQCSNEFYLVITEEGKLYYHENNGDREYWTKAGDNLDFHIHSAAGFNDGQWHKVAVRRYYDAGTDLLNIQLSVFTDDVLVDTSAQSRTITPTKKEQYVESGNEFTARRILQIGTRRDNLWTLQGEIGEIRMWDYALSDEALSQPHFNLKGTEEGLLHCFVMEDADSFVDLVTSRTENELTADMVQLWLDDYVIGDADWRIAVLPDMQHQAESYEVFIRKYFTWIKENAEAYNIKLLISVGDMVNEPNPEQMHIMSEAASIIDGVIPFMPLLGNHDYTTRERDSRLWNEYFPYEKYSQYDYFGGAFEEGKMDNYYYIMNIEGTDYLFMGLEVAVRPAVAQWAGDVIAAHPNHQVIISNHAYMNVESEIMAEGMYCYAGQYQHDDGMEATELYDCLISKHDNIQLVLCGHVSHYVVGRRTDVTESGHVVNSLCFDMSLLERQHATPQMIGLLGFTNGSNTVKVNNYSIRRDQYFKETDQFEITFDWDQEYVPAPEISVTVDEAMAQKVASAKDALFSGNANAYVAIAGSATSIVTDKTYAADAKLNVFGTEVSAWYAQGGNVYVHILALGAAETVTLKGETDVIVQTNAFASGELEVVTPDNINHSYYDYLLHNWHATITADEQIGFTSAKAVGENTVICFNGEYRMAAVSRSLGRNVALIDVAGEDLSCEIALIEGDTFRSGKLNITCQKEITVDGDISDWNENILATGQTMVGLGDTANKNVSFYACMTDEGLYVAAEADHGLYVNDADLWWKNTNLEFFLNGQSVQMWVTANPALAHEKVQGVMKTVKNGNGYTSVAEGFVAMEDLPQNALSGELQIGFAWKTPTDMIKYHHMINGGEWWFPSGRFPSERLEQYFVNASGIGLYTTVRPENNIRLDGDFSDFSAEALANKLSVYSQDGSVGFDTVAQYIPGHGVYVGLKAQSKTNPMPIDTNTWHHSTNMEFYIGENKYYITNRGAAIGNGLYAKNVYLEQTYDETAALYYTTIEFFIPASGMATANNENYLRMGFAFKPTGEYVLLNGYTEKNEFWHLYGCVPSDTANQFYVYKNGIHMHEQPNYVPYVAMVNGTGYDTVQEAVNAANGGVVKLFANSDEEVTAQGDLYLDLNGYSLNKVTVSGILYGMDSATNAYEASNAKISDVEGTYAAHYRNSDRKRYLAIAEGEGVSFHRFYMGITNLSLAPYVTGFGYKAEFYGDEAVQAQIESIGYNLWLTNNKKVTKTADFKNLLTLRLQNFPVASHGETKVHANVMITLIDGTVIESGVTSYSMRQMVEIIAASFDTFRTAQKKAVQALCVSDETMQTWDIAPILNWKEGVSITTDYFTETAASVYTLSTNAYTDTMTDSVVRDGSVVNAASYRVKGTLSLTNADTWGQARILATADETNGYVIALEEVGENAYQIFTMSRLNENAWNDWRLISHHETNGDQNSIDFELVVNGGKITFLLDDEICYENSRVAMTTSTPGFGASNVATCAVSNLDAQVFADAEEAESYLATKEKAEYVSHYQTRMDALYNEYIVENNCTGKGGTLIFGDSYMDFWNTWESQLDLTNYENGYNVGIGGAAIRDWFLAYERLVKPFAPERIILNIGYNDINVWGDNGEEFTENLRTLFETVHADFPETEIYYIYINPSPSVYANGAYTNWKVEDAINRSKELVAGLDYVTGVDIFDLMTTEDGKNPVGAYYVSDKVHLSEEGYTVFGNYLYERIFRSGYTGFFGATGDYKTGAQFDLSGDTGANVGTVNVSENGISLGYANEFYEDSFYFETKIHVNSIAATEAWPKFGLFVQNGTIRHHFYVDMTTALTAATVGRMTVTDGNYDWANTNTATVSGMAFSGEGETITMGVLKDGKYLHLFIDGQHVLSYESDMTGNAVVGVFGFNTSMTLTEYFTDTSAETLAAKAALLTQ